MRLVFRMLLALLALVTLASPATAAHQLETRVRGHELAVPVPCSPKLAPPFRKLRLISGNASGRTFQAFLYAGAPGPIAELAADGATLEARFVYATRGHVPDYLVKGGQTYRLITDQLGSVRLVVDVASGSVAQELTYDPWGRVLSDTNPGFQPFGFAGGLYDGDTGLVRFGARDYDADAGRWTAKDPIGFAGRDPNLYAYVFNDPANWLDPSGLEIGHLIPPWTDPVTSFFAANADCLYFLAAQKWMRGGIGGTAASIGLGAMGSVNEVMSFAWLDIASYAVTGMVHSKRGTTNPANKPKHEAGQARVKQDYGNEKGDFTRRLPRKRPKGWKGAWPPPNE